ncbi:MAG: isoleucine--tRNA ligase [Flavobacteriaceae bacterium]
MLFPTYSHLDLPATAEEIASFWDEHLTFEASVSTREGRPPFVFYEGPPSANGLPGIHHVLARALKDIFCRYKTQQGFQVKRKAGWDTHGLPVELGVEKELGITKEDIGKTISISEYNEACREAVMRYTDVWNDLTKKMGYWVDMEDPYITYTSKYMESVWWLLSTLYKKGLIYKGYTIQPYSPMAGTGLSSHELNQPGCYRDVSDTSVTAQFETLDDTLPADLRSDTPLHILAWTTTPWTLPSNTALTVGPKISYAVVHTFNQYTFEPIRVLLAEKLISKQFGKKYIQVENQATLNAFSQGGKTIPFLIMQQIKGVDLVGIRYKQLWNLSPLPFENAQDAFRIITGDFVTTEDGTGIVHTAPTFGADDAKVAKEATPPIPPLLILDENQNPVPLVDLQGKFRTEVGLVGGKFIKNEFYPEGEAPEKSVDVEIAIRLKEENKAFKVEKYVHSYPHCWRTDAPVLYYPLDSWFIKVQGHKDRMVGLNKTIQWKPAKTGEGRFGNWLANANDWNLSRSRFWGIPLPIWRTAEGDETRVIGSIQELKEAVDEAVAAGLMIKNPFEGFAGDDMCDSNYDKVDLHKDTVDDLVLLSELGKPMYRESDLIDVWFDSGAMPYAQWHYPFENKEKVDGGGAFPADYIAEGVDQTRGWFYTLHTIATLVFDSVAYKNVVSNGLVLDKNGQKMSKRLGNAVDPFETLKTYGPDATRWYMISNANPWDNLKFDVAGIEEVKRKFFGTLYNTYAFFSLYANIDGFKFEEAAIPRQERPEIDQWILSELHTLIQNTTDHFDAYEPTRACRAISHFVTEDLSNWYVRLCRRRFWKGSYEADKIAAYQTLYECLVSVAKLMAPVSPFYADRLYQDLNSITQQNTASSVHLAYYPKSNNAFINPALEQKMQRAQKITSLVLSLRKREKIKVRQPLQRIMIPVLDDLERQQVAAISSLIASEVNVKQVELLDDTSSILVKEVKPNFKTLGPRFGKDMKLVAQAIQALSDTQVHTLEKEGALKLNLDGKEITLAADDVVISSKDVSGWLVASEQGVTVALDIQMNESLRLEGMARELVNRLQNIRKDLGFDVTDTISLTLRENDALAAALKQNKTYIQHEILATSITLVKDELEASIPISFDSLETNVNMVKSK